MPVHLRVRSVRSSAGDGPAHRTDRRQAGGLQGNGETTHGLPGQVGHGPVGAQPFVASVIALREFDAELPAVPVLWPGSTHERIVSAPPKSLRETLL